MVVNVEGLQLPITQKKVELLWNNCNVATKHTTDDTVSIRVVSEQEIQELNRTYRGKDKPTNVLTFSYPLEDALPGVDTVEHDIAVCMDVVKKESVERGAQLVDYTALILAHGFLHALGVDHEKSESEAEQMHDLEKKVLEQSGFTAQQL